MAENNEFYRLNLVLQMEDRLSQALRGVDSQVQALERSFNKAAAAAQRLGNVNVKAVVNVDTTRMENALNKVVQRLDSLNSKTATPTVVVTDRATPTINSVSQKLKNATGRRWDIALGIKDSVTKKLASIKEALTMPLGMMGLGSLGVGLGAGALVSGAIGTYKDFEHQMKTVKAISGATEEQFVSLTAKAREMGATTAFSAVEAGKAFEYMAMAGWKPEQMEAAIKPMLNLAAAGGTDLGLTSDIITDAMTAFRLDATTENVQMFTDAVAKAATSSNTDVAKMGYTFQYLATTAGALGYTIQDTALAIELAADMGIKGEKAGTSIMAALNGIASPSKQAAEALDKLGITLDDGTGKAKPLRQTMLELRDAFKDLTPLQQQQYAHTIADVRGMKALLAWVGATDKKFNEFADGIDHASDAVEENGLTFQGWAEKVAYTRMDNLEGDLRLLDSAWKDFQIGLLSGGGGDFLREFVQSATETVTEFGEVLKSPEFKELDWGDQIIFLLDKAIAKIDAWASGSGGEQFGKVLTKLAEIGIRAFISALTGLISAAVDALMQGNFAAAAGLGMGAAMIPGSGMVLGGVAKGAKAIGSAATGGINLAGTFAEEVNVMRGAGFGGTEAYTKALGSTLEEAGPMGKFLGKAAKSPLAKGAGKLVGKIAAPVAAALDIYDVATSEDKVKTGAEAAGGWAGMFAGAKVGAALGGTAGLGFLGIGAAPGAAIGGILGGIGGYFGGSKLGGGIVDTIRGLFGGGEETAPNTEGATGGGMFGGIGEMFGGVKESAGAFVDEVGETLSALPEKIAVNIGYAIGYIATTLQNLPTTISTFAAEAYEGAVKWFAQLPTTVSEKMSAMYDAVTNWASNIISGISEWFSQLPSLIGGYFDSAINAIQSKIASVKASFSLGFEAGASDGHAEGGIFSHEHIARFAEGNKPEAVIPLDISKRARGLSILNQVQNIFGLGNTSEEQAALSPLPAIVGEGVDRFARFAEGDKPESVEGGEGFSLQNVGISIFAQAREMLAEGAELLANAGGGFAPAMASAAAGGELGGSVVNGGPSFSFSGINMSFGNDLDEEELAIAIGRRFLAEIRQGQENRG